MNCMLNDFCFGLILISLFPLEFSKFYQLVNLRKKGILGPTMKSD